MKETTRKMKAISRAKEIEKWQHEEWAWAKDIAGGAREEGLEAVVNEITSAGTQSSREADVKLCAPCPNT